MAAVPADPRAHAPRLSIAMSGGGFRATLFSLGALLYLVDARGNDRIDSVVSVSGGSITSAAVAAGCELGTVDLQDFDHVAARIAVNVRRGLLRSAPRALVLVVGIILLSLGLVIESFADWPLDVPWWSGLIGFVLIASALVLRGAALAWLVEKQFLGGARPRMGDIGGNVAHIFAATDLNSGAPLYISTSDGGIIDSPVLETAPCPWLTLRDAVRASAAFPGGFPPKRVAMSRSGLTWKSRTGGVDDVEEAFMWDGRNRIAGRVRQPRALFLSDGGVWNNLGSDWRPRLKEDEMPGSTVRLVVDASAPVASRRMGGLDAPGVNEVLAVFRTMTILYCNTVDPRIRALEGEAAHAVRQRWTGGEDWVLPAVTRVVDGRAQMWNRHRRICQLAGVGADEDLFRGPRGEIEGLWTWLIDTHHEIHGPTRPGLRLWNSTVATTLGRVDRATAISLLMHGYVGAMTALHAYAGFPVPSNGKLDLDRFARLVDGRPGETAAFDVTHGVVYPPRTAPADPPGQSTGR